MDINLTLIVQMLVFVAFVLFTMKFVWPPLSKAMEERQNKIADGLSAAERARKELELAQHRATDELRQAKAQAGEIIEKATKRATSVIEEAKQDARLEGQKQLKIAQEQMHQEANKIQDALRKQASELAISIAEKILQREVDKTTNTKLTDDLLEEI